jgi:ligand-binding sensor domain-containing protein
LKQLFFLYILLVFLSYEPVAAQSNTVHFNRTDYKAGAQNWAFHQDATGILYVANNEGLLTFDGDRWQLHPLPNNTILRSLSADDKGRLYAGGQDEFGYFEPDACGRLRYTSLVGLLDPAYRLFSDIWNIVVRGDNVFFQSFTTIFRLYKNQVFMYPASLRWDYMGTASGHLVAHEKSAGLFSFSGDRWDTLVPARNLPDDFSITSVVPYQNAIILSTAMHGIWSYDGNKLQPHAVLNAALSRREHITSMATLPTGEILIGTYHNGLYYLDSTARLMENYSRKNELLNNNIKSIYRDNRGQVWLGLEDGIALLELNNPIRQINPPLFNAAAGYSTAISDGQLYFALGSGLFSMPMQDVGNNPVANWVGMRKIADGLTWSVSKVGQHLIVGRDDGLYKVVGNQLIPIDKSSGYWNFKQVGQAGGKPLYVGGNYFGLTYFEEMDGRLIKLRKVPSFNTSSRFLEYDSTNACLWVSHPYRGIYKIKLETDKVEYYAEEKGLSSSLNNHIFLINNRILATTNNGIYAYEAYSNRFKQSKEYEAVLGNTSLRYLTTDAARNLWLVNEKTPGVFDVSKNAAYLFPELQRKLNSGFEHIFPLDSNQVLVGAEQGYFIINYLDYLHRKEKPSVFIRRVSAFLGKDTILHEGFANPDLSSQSVKLSHHSRSLVFYYASPYSILNRFVEYSYRVRGFDEKWSAWNQRTELSYAHLPPGNYVFEVKARNNLFDESEVASYAFEIFAPWYNTLWAKLFYFLLFIVVVGVIMKWRVGKLKARHHQRMSEAQARYEEEQKLLAYRHQLEMEQSEKELIRLQNEKLESELAATAMNLVQKKEFLQKLREEINKIKNAAQDSIDPADLKKIVKDLIADDKLDDEWQQFSAHFNTVHNNFLVTLKEKFPQLSAHDLKLCAYLRMNLSSKEMARLMSISIRGVEINRYRLRKKLLLQPKENLFDFFMGVEQEAMQNAHSSNSQANRGVKPNGPEIT